MATQVTISLVNVMFITNEERGELNIQRSIHWQGDLQHKSSILAKTNHASARHPSAPNAVGWQLNSWFHLSSTWSSRRFLSCQRSLQNLQLNEKTIYIQIQEETQGKQLTYSKTARASKLCYVRQAVLVHPSLV